MSGEPRCRPWAFIISTPKISGWRGEKEDGRLKISLYTRFMLWIALLLVILVGTILFVIEKREVRTIFQETKNRGILIAQYIANMNLRPLTLWDEESLLQSAENQVDENLIYIVFYDRFGKPLAASESVRSVPDIYSSSRLSAEARPDDYFYESKFFTLGTRRISVLEIELPIFVTGAPSRWASIKIGHSLEEMRGEIRRIRLVLIVIGLGGFLIGILGSTFLAKRITRPLKQLVDGTVKISAGDFSHRIELATRDEIGDLARSFNEMTGQLLQARIRMEAASRKLVQAEKLASIGRLSATIAHEIRNPLTSVKLNIQKVAENEVLDEVEREHLTISQEGITQIEKFIKELLNFTRASELNCDRFSLEQILEESLKVLKAALQEKGIIVEKDYDTDLPDAFVDGDKMRQVFLNVLRNAYEAVDEGGKITVSLGLCSENGKKRYRVRVSDNGSGVPEKDWENIFEPFFTTKSQGFGLGLANSRKIVEQHNGTIKLTKKGGGGSTFVISLPCEEGL